MVNYVFVDYENLQPQAVALLNHGDFKIMVFVGALQKKLPLDLVTSLQRLGERVEYVVTDGSGPNALDFLIAYHMGRIAAQDPECVLHIVSKDKGFDPLIRHLRNKGTRCARVETVGFLPVVDNFKGMNLEERASIAIQMLFQYSGQPKTLKRLRQTLNALFQHALAEVEIASVIEMLVKRGSVILGADESVSYSKAYS